MTRKISKNGLNFNDAEERIASKLLEISIPIVDRIILKLESRLGQNFTFVSIILSEI